MFVVCGEALMDVFTAGDTPTGVALDARIGGSPLNVAIGLARLAQPVAFMGALSSDFLGERLLRALRSEGVQDRCVQRVDAPTTLSLVGLDAQGVAAYAFYGHAAADRQLSLAALDTLPGETRAIHFGSYAMVVEPVAETQRALVAREHGRRLISYDPNVRLRVEPDLARWRVTLDWMLPRTHLLKISDEDLGLLYPGADTAALVAHWLSQGVALVVVTRGSAGALAWTAQHMLQVPSPSVAVVDTVGAGDTYQAALLNALAETNALDPAALRAMSAEALQHALGFAARAAALTCTRRGADMPRRDDVR